MNKEFGQSITVSARVGFEKEEEITTCLQGIDFPIELALPWRYSLWQEAIRHRHQMFGFLQQAKLRILSVHATQGKIEVLPLVQLKYYLEKEGRNWIVTQRNAHRLKGCPLESSTCRVIWSFFQSDTLNIARICEVSQIENPPFYKELKEQGIPMPLDFRDMAGITFIDTILIAPSKIGTESWISLVFHECIHVAQHLFLGVDRFAHEYVTGWENSGFDYFKIPLEVQAYQLQQLFDLNQQSKFSVERKIAQKWGHYSIG